MDVLGDLSLDVPAVVGDRSQGRRPAYIRIEHAYLSRHLHDGEIRLESLDIHLESDVRVCFLPPTSRDRKEIFCQKIAKHFETFCKIRQLFFEKFRNFLTEF